jgi:Rps23 Pro-64 3,4-dihydroxylase Tpa1-like proline 4-hydroxylase
VKEIYPSVWVFEKAFANPSGIYESVEKFVDNNLSFSWKWAQTDKPDANDSLQDSMRTNQIFYVSANAAIQEIKEIDTLIFNGTTDFIKQYSSHYLLGGLTDEGYAILKYEKGTMYKQHHDCGGSNKGRVVSMLVYLNDDFVGGELEFPHIGVKHKPSAGDIVLFPSNYTFSHIAHPVTEGTKYAVVSWLAYE